MSVVSLAFPARPRALRAAAAAIALALPVAAAVGLEEFLRSPLVLVMLTACVLGILAAARVGRLMGGLGLWLVLVLLSILAGGMSSISFGGQNGHLLWADAVLGTGVVCALVAERFRVTVPRAPFLERLWPFLAWGAVSLVLCRDVLSGVSELKEWMAAALVGVAAARYVTDGNRARVLLGAVGVTGALIGAQMVYVTVTSPMGPLFALIFKLADLPWGRTNYLAGLIILAIPLTVGLLGHARSIGLRALWAAVLLLNVAGLVVSSSKGAILALLAGAFASYGLDRRARAVRWIFFGVLAVGAALFVAGPLHEAARYHLQQDALGYSASERMELYRLAWDRFLTHPVFGLGLDNFSVVLNRLRGVDTVPHNFELGFLAEVGLPGLVLALAWAWALGATAWRARARAGDARERSLALGLWGAFVGFAVHNQFESTIYGQQYKMMLMAVAAATWRLSLEFGRPAWPREGEGSCAASPASTG